MDAVKFDAYEDKFFTIEDIYALPEDQYAELIDGELYMMATPSMIHQRIVMELCYKIRNYIGQKNGSCEVFPSPFAVFLNADDTIYLEPDISVICDKDKLTDEGCKGAPDWIIEIVSPTSRPRDYGKKLFMYRTACVREYWIVDHERNLIMQYDFEHDQISDYTFTDMIKTGIFEDFKIDFSRIKIT